jgi:hypothetical protein
LHIKITNNAYEKDASDAASVTSEQTRKDGINITQPQAAKQTHLHRMLSHQ